ncbi:hypothetical protein BMS3Abin05_01060 [bacterium BMS3Abin05]|nr:hypothetical protein BMS3Abin05_01060 [bacterium BMS3Abin05]
MARQPQNPAELIFCGGHVFRIFDFHPDRQRTPRSENLLKCAERDVNADIQILAKKFPLFPGHPDHAKIVAPKVNAAINGIHAVKEIFRHIPADDGHVGSVPDIRRNQEPPNSQIHIGGLGILFVCPDNSNIFNRLIPVAGDGPGRILVGNSFHKGRLFFDGAHLF